MEEQKMSILQRSRIENYLKNGAPLPKPTPLRMNTTKCRPNIDFHRARTAKRRTLAAIKASGALEFDKWVLSPEYISTANGKLKESLIYVRYHPKPTSREPCEQQKLRLQAKMSGIKDINEADCELMMQNGDSKANETEEIDPIDECNLNFFHCFFEHFQQPHEIACFSVERDWRTGWMVERNGSAGRRQETQGYHNEPDCRTNANNQENWKRQSLERGHFWCEINTFLSNKAAVRVFSFAGAYFTLSNLCTVCARQCNHRSVCACVRASKWDVNKITRDGETSVWHIRIS